MRICILGFRGLFDTSRQSCLSYLVEQEWFSYSRFCRFFFVHRIGIPAVCSGYNQQAAYTDRAARFILGIMKESGGLCSL